MSTVRLGTNALAETVALKVVSLGLGPCAALSFA